MRKPAATPETHSLHVPFRIAKRGGRKQIITPDGNHAATESRRPRIDNTLIKALARSFRWRQLLESGAYGSIDEIANAEKINPSYVSRMLRLTLLAPDIVENILGGRQSGELALAALMKPFPVTWSAQRQPPESN